MKINPIVLEALKNNKPVVALESTIISHGMPYPKNVETALSPSRPPIWPAVCGGWRTCRWC